jgi:Concanavalin A-like lectin/glucanases superfamily/Dolichyl-phosphate-mannose-protein mannosyltransferase
MQLSENTKIAFRHTWVHIMSLIFLCGLLTFFFVKNNYTDYPFYQRADCDALYSPLSVALINDGNLTTTAHPGATVLSIYGGIYRGLSFISQAYKGVFDISRMKTRVDASKTLTVAIVTGRVIALLTILFFSIVYYLTLVRLTEHWLIAFISTFIVVTSSGVLYHIAIIRPECLSIAFFFLAVLFFLLAIKVEKQSALRCGLLFVACGFASGMAVLSKIQIGPLLAILALLTIFSVVFHADLLRFRIVSKRKLLVNVVIAISLIIITPWWSLKKPSFLAPELVSYMSSDFQRVYGNLPETFLWEVLIGCLVLAGIAIGIWSMRTRLPRIYIKKLYYLSFVMNLSAVGALVSVYLVLVPVSVSFNGYVTNTNHLVYSVFTNISGAGFLENSGASFYTYIKSILLLHSAQSSVAKVNLIYIVAIAGLFCIIKCCFFKTESKLVYLVPIIIFVSAFVMDLFSAMRTNHPTARYAIYSIGVYVMGLAYLANIECAGAFQKPLRINWSSVKCFAIVAVFIMHLIIMPIKPDLWPSIPNSTEWCWSLVRYLAPEFPADHVLSHKGEFVFSQTRHKEGYDIFFSEVGKPLGCWLFNNNTSGDINFHESINQVVCERQFPTFRPGDKIVVVDKAENMELNDFTVCLWVNILQMPLSGGRGETHLFGAADLSLGLTIVNGGLYDREIWGYSSGGSGQVRSGWAIAKEEWYHVALVKEKQKLYLYIDGQEVGKNNVVASGRRPEGNIGCNLGNKPASISATFMIASAALWSKALSFHEIKKLYDLQK